MRKKIGGNVTFIDKFADKITKRGVEVTHDIHDGCQNIIVIGSYPLSKIIFAKRKKINIIQRLDGLYYYRVKGFLFFLWNLKIKIIHNYFADFVIYQSAYSQYICQRYLGQARAPSKLIYNGVDEKIFSPDGNKIVLRGKPNQKILFTAGSFRREEMIIPIIEAVKLLYNKIHDDFKLVIAGSIDSKILHKIESLNAWSYIKWVGRIDNDQIAVYARSSDIFLFSDTSACPNIVIEAMACGLPVIAFDRGGVKEIVGSEAGILIDHSKNEMWKLKKFNINDYANAIEKMIKGDLNNYKSNARKRVIDKFTIDSMVDQYIDAIK